MLMPQGQPQPQQMAQPPQAPQAAPPEQAMQPGMGQPQTPDMGAAIDEALGNLDEQSKQFLAVMLTPETVKMVGILFGDEVEAQLQKYADPNVVLVPVPRNEFMQFTQGQQTSPEVTPVAEEGIAAPAAPTTPAPVAA